jgi:hypothetical protein
MSVTGKARALMVVLGMALAAGAQDVLIVANRGVSASQISGAQLRDIFIGARSLSNDGTRVAPVVLKGGPVREVFLRKHVGDNPEEFRARWRKAIFTGQGSMPKECRTEGEQLDYLGITPGAIGYVSRVSETNSVKVLRVSP